MGEANQLKLKTLSERLFSLKAISIMGLIVLASIIFFRLAVPIWNGEGFSWDQSLHLQFITDVMWFSILVLGDHQKPGAKSLTAILDHQISCLDTIRRTYLADRH